MPIVLRQLDRIDMVGAAAVHRTSFDERLPWLAGRHTPEEDRAFFADVVFQRCEVWGCFEAAVLLGFIAFRGPHIEHLYVLPSHQGRGVGTILLSLAQERCDELDLWTFQRNEPARGFYEHRGFIAIETTDGARNEECEPDVCYRWRSSRRR